MERVLFVIVFLLAFAGSAHSMTPAEEKLLFQTLGEIKGELKQVNGRIDDINKRIDDTNKRIEDVNKQLSKRIEDMNKQLSKRIEDVNKQLSKRIDDTNKKIENLRNDMNARFEQHFKYMELMIAGMFGLVAAFAGLLFWDRRTIIAEAKRQTLEELERDIKPEKLRRLLNVAREFARENEKFREILKKEGLL